MKLAAVVFVFLASCLACANQSEEINDQANPKDGLTYLALGDSYTIGESAPQQERWPVLLAKDITAGGIKVASPDIIAKTGWTTANLLSNLGNVTASKPYDLVSLLIGVNNEYQGLGVEQYRTEFATLLQKSIAFAGGKPDRVFVLSIPDWGATPAGMQGRDLIAKEIEEYNTVAREECAKEKILFIDITPLSKIALTDPSLVAADRLHYTGKMYQRWVDEAVPKVKQLL